MKIWSVKLRHPIDRTDSTSNSGSAEFMTLFETLSLIVWTVSSVTVLISLWLVYRQTAIFSKQTDYVARSLTETRSENLNNQVKEITRVFITYPELRPYFYEGRVIEPNDVHYHRAAAVAELILDIFWSMSATTERLLPYEFSPDGQRLWEDYLADSFSQSPILVQTLTEHQAWYGQAIVDQMNNGLKRRSSGTAS
jgi:hypothetical protein